MSPYSIKYRVRFTAGPGYDDRYFSEYVDAMSFITDFLREHRGGITLHVLLMGPRGLIFGEHDDVLAEHYAYSLQVPGDTGDENTDL